MRSSSSSVIASGSSRDSRRTHGGFPFESPKLPALPADVIGVPIEYDFSGTIEQALAWHPKARRLVVVTGASGQDREWEARLRTEVQEFAGRATPEFLAGLPTGAVLERLRGLGGDAIVFTPVFFRMAKAGFSTRARPRNSSPARPRRRSMHHSTLFSARVSSVAACRPSRPWDARPPESSRSFSPTPRPRHSVFRRSRRRSSTSTGGRCADGGSTSARSPLEPSGTSGSRLSGRRTGRPRSSPSSLFSFRPG